MLHERPCNGGVGSGAMGQHQRSDMRQLGHQRQPGKRHINDGHMADFSAWHLTFMWGGRFIFGRPFCAANVA
jgi:hypothetical protein